MSNLQMSANTALDLNRLANMLMLNEKLLNALESNCMIKSEIISRKMRKEKPLNASSFFWKMTSF